MAAELVKSDDLTTDTSKSRIGNPEGLALLSRLDSFGNQIKDIQKRMERPDRLLDFVLVLRHGILDEWVGQPRDPDEVQERNAVAHESIAMDIEAILLMFQVQPERASRWEKAFSTYYRDFWPEVASNTLKTGSRIATIFNIYANSKCLYRYQKGCNTQRKDQVMALCEQWVTKWKSDHTLEIPPEVFEGILALDRDVY
ncbi:hypothetical protein PENNAL_c0010G05100 [Penicillium nalgiovense]|uniref:Uncharacterized protein n=1 Tax=Penicillium nalgiovense TaxID=60175 RepID=A0A1V6YV45_PENNA|nr:hypothetical protein PENNAL_c0010G05100 [Penicillium nalgiovense]